MTFRKTKIIATTGPSWFKNRVLKEMIRSGMNCARINTAHGDFKEYQTFINRIRKTADIPVMIDIKGPEVRIRTPKDLPVKKENTLRIYFKKKFPRFSSDFHKNISKGDVLFIDNGTIKAAVVAKRKDSIELKFAEDAVIQPNKGVNIPHKNLGIPPLSKKDRQAVEFAKKNNLAYIALSFVRDSRDVLRLKKLIGDRCIKIISKIENHQGLENIDKIIDASDAIMIARGDLGIEMPQEKIPFFQKDIIRKCLQKAKPCIVATQMLDSMTYNPMPTRAEISDVANAVLDGADAVMLSGETAIGRHPVKAVTTMASVVKEVEASVDNKISNSQASISEELSMAAYSLAKGAKAGKIICTTRSGYVARLMSRFRFSQGILAVTDDRQVKRQLELVWGVKPVYMQIPKTNIVSIATQRLYNKGLISANDLAVYLGGLRTVKRHVLNIIEIHQVSDLLKYEKS